MLGYIGTNVKVTVGGVPLKFENIKSHSESYIPMVNFTDISDTTLGITYSWGLDPKMEAKRLRRLSKKWRRYQLQKRKQ